MIWNDQRHRNGRHGHGAAEFPGKPGLEKGFLSSIQAGEVDPRFRENELMLTVNDEFGVWSFPYEEIWKAGHAVNVEINGVPIAVLCLPGTNTAGAHHRTDDGEVLSFERSSGGLFVDDRTGSRWNVEGLCVSGARKGISLNPRNSSRSSGMPPYLSIPSFTNGPAGRRCSIPSPAMTTC